MAELSREAMALLELSPIWRRRDQYRDTPVIDQPSAGGLQIAVLAADAASQALWRKISTVLIGLGFPSAVLDQSIVVQGPHADVLTQRLHQQRPESLLVLGNVLLQAAQEADVTVFTGLQVIAAPSLAECLSSTQAKRQLWTTLSQLQRQFSDGISPPR